MSRRRIMQSQGGELPSGYTRCKYLESSGTQWIDTKCIAKASDDDVIEIEYAYKNKTDTFVFSASYNLNRLHLYNSSVSEYAVIGIGSGFCNMVPISVGNKNRAIIYTNGYINPIINNVSYNYNSPNPYSKYTSNKQLKLFGNESSFGLIKIYKFEINRKINLLPFLDPQGKPCMYDTVTQKPFYNSGTGEFGYELMDGTYVEPV